MQKTILTYGFLSGAVAAVLMLGMTLYLYQTNNFEGGEVVGYAGILLSMLFVYVGTRSYREQQGGTISFGKAFQVSMAIALISCACYVVAWLLVYQNLMPDFIDKFAQLSMDKMKREGATEAQITAAAAEMAHFKEMYKNPLFRAAITFIEPLPVGLLVSLVSSFLLRRKEKF